MTAGSGGRGPRHKRRTKLHRDIALDTGWNLFIATNSSVVQKVDTSGIISTVAGNSSQGFSGHGGPAKNAAMNTSRGVTVDASGNVSAGAFGAFATASPSPWIVIYGSNVATDTRSWQGGDFSGVSAPTSLDGASVTTGSQDAFIDYISPGQVK
jgi:hypothetical protein